MFYCFRVRILIELKKGGKFLWIMKKLLLSYYPVFKY